MNLLRALLLLSPAIFAADFVGSKACKTCHPDIWSTFYKNPHFKSLASGKESQENTGCESCHGPGKAHVDATGGKATIVAFSQLARKNAGRVSALPRPDHVASQYPAQFAHPAGRGLHQLPFDPQIDRAQIPTRETTTIRAVLHLPCRAFARSSPCPSSIA